MSALFTPYRLGSLELRNRIVIAPMCQYTADEGRATDWHVIHLGNLALSGAGLLIIEATAVLPEGKLALTISGFGLPKPKTRWGGWSKPCGGIQTCRSPSSSRMRGARHSNT